MNISKEAKIIFKGLKLINFKSKVKYHKPSRTNLELLIKKEFKTYQITNNLIEVNSNKNKVVLFLAGGAYTFQVSRQHLKFVKSLGYHTYIYDYPKVPESTSEHTISKTVDIYKQILKTHDEIILFGDSAGGGLALSLLQEIKNNELTPPSHTILVSPWLDLSLSNTKIQGYKDLDVILDYDSLKTLGEQYAGNNKTNDPIFSPIFLNDSLASKILLIYGSEEIFTPDCEHFYHLQKQLGTKIIERVFEGMCHDFIVFNIPETNQLITEITEFIEN
jgi:acetyl esterase/lipase